LALPRNEIRYRVDVYYKASLNLKTIDKNLQLFLIPFVPSYIQFIYPFIEL
jgi:hypothetical protein